MIPISGSKRLPSFLIIPVVSTLVALSPARSSTLASAGAGAARARPVNQDAVAKRLAMGVMAAPTDDARSRALIAVMKALHIGVYTPRGRAIVRGYERGPRDFYLYDFELQAMATAIGQKRFWSSADLAAAFAPLFSSGAQAPTAQTIEEALRSTSRAAVNRPKDKRSLFPLLVRELGLRHATPYDLAGAVSSSQPQLDALQMLLISAEALLPFVRATHRWGQSTLLDGRGVFQRHAVPRVNCGSYRGSQGNWQLDSNISKTLLGEGNYTGLSGVVTVGTVIDVLQGIEIGRIALEVGAVTPLTGNDTHYGPPGHAPLAGKVPRFTVSVQGDFKYSSPVDCGMLAGFTPPRGGVSDIPVKWIPTQESLDQYGQVSYDPPLKGGQQLTGANGQATMIFTPKPEPLPGAGSEQGVDYSLTGVVALQDAHVSPRIKPLFAAAGNPALPFLGRISWHAYRGFKFDNVRYHMDFAYRGQPAGGADWLLSGSTCGSNPLSSTWNLHASLVSSIGSPWPGTYSVNRTYDATLTFQSGETATWFLGDYQAALRDKTLSAIDEMKLLPPPSPTINMHFYIGAWAQDVPSGASVDPGDFDIQAVPLQDNPSCPRTQPFRHRRRTRTA